MTPTRPAKTRLDLTARQRDVAGLYAIGLTTKAIGVRLGISSRTVDNHLDVIHDKIGHDPERTRRQRIRDWWHVTERAA